MIGDSCLLAAVGCVQLAQVSRLHCRCLGFNQRHSRRECLPVGRDALDDGESSEEKQ